MNLTATLEPGPARPTPATTKLHWLLLVTALTSVVHYADNLTRWALYPEPTWDNARLTDAFWFLMTPFAIAAFVLNRRGKPRQAILASYVYGAMNLVVLGHYLFRWPWDISLAVNGTILAEAGMAAWVIAQAASMHLALPRTTTATP